MPSPMAVHWTFAPSAYSQIMESRRLLVAMYGPRISRFERGSSKVQREVLFSGAPLVFEGGGGRANAPGADMNLQAGVGGFGAQSFEVRFLEILERVQVGDEKRVSF